MLLLITDHWHLCADLLAERRFAAVTAERRPEVVHLHMSEALSTTECLSYFARYETVSVEWVDQHSCRSSSLLTCHLVLWCCCEEDNSLMSLYVPPVQMYCNDAVSGMT